MLQTLGLVEKIIDSPTKYTALPMNEAITILLNRQLNEISEIKVKTRELFHNRKKNYAKIASFQDNPQFVLIPSKEVLINRLRKAIENTQTSIDVATSCKRFKLACYSLSDVLEKAWLRAVKGRVVVENTEESSSEIVKASWKSPHAEIRYISTIPKTVMVLYDKKEVFIYVEPKADLKDSPALWSNNPSLLAMAEDCFETVWKTAKK